MSYYTPTIPPTVKEEKVVIIPTINDLLDMILTDKIVVFQLWDDSFDDYYEEDKEEFNPGSCFLEEMEQVYVFEDVNSYLDYDHHRLDDEISFVKKNFIYIGDGMFHIFQTEEIARNIYSTFRK